MKNKYIYIFGVVGLALASYFYLAQNQETPELGQADISESVNSPQTIDPKDILKYDPNAPEWMQNAESCTKVGEKIFCKLKGE